MIHRFSVRLELPKPVEEVFDFFGRAENLERITPPELQFRIVTAGPIVMTPGTLIDYRLRLFGVPFTWRTEITNWDPPHQFIDTQLSGPYRQWVHRHRFMPTARGTEILDDVLYQLPLAPLGDLAYPLVRLQLSRIFGYRTEAVRRLLA